MDGGSAENAGAILRQGRNPVSFFGALVLVLCVICAAPAHAQPGGKPAAIAGAIEFAFTSATNQRDYRLFVYLPPDLDSSLSYPVLYLLDGNAYFATATDMTRRLGGDSAPPTLVVGVGYPGEALDDWVTRRTYDLTPSISNDPAEVHETGGAAQFLRVLQEEIKPFVEARYNVDRARQTLFGHSLGGLFALHVLFTQPEAFSNYVSSSPSIWFNDRELLRAEPAFAERVRAGTVAAGLLLTSAADEQYRGEDRALLEDASHARMVDNTSELAARLAQLASSRFRVEREIFVNENHNSVSFAALGRALRFTQLQP
jgi:predicted alpha/beta superfamily hydrolase